MRFRPLKTISLSFTAFIIILAFPAFAILASWNSIPDSTLYPVKRGLEKTALAILPNSVLEMGLRYRLIDRRLNEAKTALIRQHSDQAFTNIVAEAKSAQVAIQNLNPEIKSEARGQLIEKLTQTTVQISEINTTAYISPPTTSPPQDSVTLSQKTPSTIPSAPQPEQPASIPAPAPPTTGLPSTTSPPSTTQTQTTTIITVQEELEEIIEELEEEQALIEQVVEEKENPEKSKGKHKGWDKKDKDNNQDD
jgi:hypothetical protein